MRYLFCLLFLNILSFHIHSQQISTASIDFSSYAFSFNEIKDDGGIVNCNFELINSSNSALIIKDIITSCGCASASWIKQPIAPGMAGTINVQFDPKERFGPFSEEIHVLSNAKDSDVMLTIKGFVIPGNTNDTLKYRIGDLSLKSTYINFGYIYKGNSESKKLEIANYTDKPIHIELSKLPSYIDALIYPSTLKPGGYGRIMVYYNTDNVDNWDYVIDRIGIIINGAEYSNSKLTVSANIREDFSKLTPEVLAMAPSAVFQSDTHNFGTISNKKAISCKFLLQNKGQSDLVIHAVKPSCGCTVVLPEKKILAAGKSTYIKAKLDPKQQKGEFIKSITVITNDPKDYKHFLWLKGNAKN